MTEHPIATALQERILNTINDALGEHGGGIVNAFLLAIDYLDHEGEPAFIITCPPDQRGIATAGLATLLKISSDTDLRHALSDD